MDNFNYKAAVIHTAALTSLHPNQIFIIWYFKDSNGKFVRYRKTFGINKIEDLKVRSKTASLICDAINELLKNGINPESMEQLAPTSSYTNIVSALKECYSFIESRIEKKRSITTYSNNFKLFIEYLKKNGYSKYNITDFKKLDANKYQKHLINSKLSNKTINGKTAFASLLFKEAIRIDLISDDPFDRLPKLKLQQHELELYTAKELKQIKDYLYYSDDEKKQNLFVAGMFIYYAFMRPESIVNLQIKHIDFTADKIHVPAEIHKNSKYSIKQILPAFKKYISKYNGMDPELYLFSKNLAPAHELIRPREFAYLWKDLVKEHLKIDKNMYSLKHTGAVNYLKNNKGMENIKWLQMQMGHSDLATTSIYTNKQKDFFLTDTDNVIDEI